MDVHHDSKGWQFVAHSKFIMHIALMCILMTLIAIACDEIPPTQPDKTYQPAETLQWDTLPRPQLNNLYDVSFVNAMTGVAVGASGTIIRTLDGGASWEIQNSGTNLDLYGVECSDEHNCYAVGSELLVLKTTDGGAHWNSALSNGSAKLIDVWSHHPDTVRIVGFEGVISMSVDGGSTWIGQSVGYTPWHYTVSFINDNTGIVAGLHAEIYRTDDGGNTWVAQKGLGSLSCYSAQLLDSLNGFVVGSRSLLTTSDGGDTWVKQYSPIPDVTVDYLGVWFADLNIGTAVAEKGYIVRTIDGGKNWKIQKTNVSTDLHGISVIDDSTCFVVGDSGMILQSHEPNE